MPGLPPLYGGLVFLNGDPNTLLIGGDANTEIGALYRIGVQRDGAGHITGFSGEAQRFADAAFNDGGIVYGPDGVLFLARWPENSIGQTKPGSSITDKIVDTSAFVCPYLAALNFVPAGFPGAGQLKLVSWSGGCWYTAGIEPDGNGTFNVTSFVSETTITGGPEGFIYVPPGSPAFASFDSMLVAEYSDGNIAAYGLDDNGDPEPASRGVFIAGLSGAEGAAIDPLTGDFLFSTFGGGDQVVAIRGFAAPPTPTPTGEPATPTQTSTAVPVTNTPAPPTATATLIPPTATNTLAAPTATLPPPTATRTPVPPTATRTPTNTPVPSPTSPATATPSATHIPTRAPTSTPAGPPTAVPTATLPPTSTPPPTATEVPPIDAPATATAEALSIAGATATSEAALEATATAQAEERATATSRAQTATARAPTPTRESEVLGVATPSGSDSGGGPPRAQRPVFGAGAGQPKTTAAILGLDQISKDPKVVGTNIVLAIILLIVLLLSSTVFNETVNEHRVELQAFGARLFAPFAWLGERVRALTPAGLSERSRLNFLLGPLLLLGVTALVYSFNEPHLAFDGQTALLYSSLLIAIGVTTYIAEGGEALMANRRFGVEAGVRLVPVAIAIAAVFVLTSRLVSFDAPIMYGFIASATVLGAAGLDRRDAATAVLVPAIALLAASVGAWLLLPPLRDMAQHNSQWWSHVPSEAAAIIFVGGIEGLMFVLLPLRFTDGEKIFRWYRWLWFPLFGVSAFLFCWVVLNPQAKAFDAVLEGRVIFIACLVGIYAILATGFWAYFWQRSRHESHANVT